VKYNHVRNARCIYTLWYENKGTLFLSSFLCCKFYYLMSMLLALMIDYIVIKRGSI
jgi:hypothetical protein